MISAYPSAIEFLYGLRLFGTKLGLDNTFRLASLAEDPQTKLRFIHVAGTNGKGSTCAMLESIYRASGLRVGLFTSPHLVSFRERIQVNRELIGEGDVVRLVARMQERLEQFPAGLHPTFFEVVAVMALEYFVEQECELVIWETGLGGRLDATNIVTPLASVITNVQLDHEKWLGSTLPEIAAEKAGIIKPGVPVVTAVDAPEAREVIVRTAAAQNAPLVEVDRTHELAAVGELHLSLRGAHQQLNAAVALATVRTLQRQIPVPPDRLHLGLESVAWLGRFEVERLPSGQTVVLDGAHNPAGAEILRAALQDYFPNQAPAILLGVMRDKDWLTMCRILVPLASRIVFVPVQSGRTAAPEDLLEAARRIAPDCQVSAAASLTQAWQELRQEPLVLITGSLHLIGSALELLKIVPSSGGEQSLNEWDASRESQKVAG